MFQSCAGVQSHVNYCLNLSVIDTYNCAYNFNYSILSLSTSVFFSACEKELLKTAELKCCYVY